MLEHEWEKTLSQWAHAQSDIKALVQIGSRVQGTGRADQWSDFDYQLITSRPERYLDGSFARQIAHCWAVGINRAFGNVTKVSAVYADSLEVDFVVLKQWEVRAATTALRFANTERWWPLPLRRGTEDLRRVAGLGWKMVKGGRSWEDRYGRIKSFRAPLGERKFYELCGEFWSQMVWARKKIARGEFLAAQRAFHEILFEHTLCLLEEEVVLKGGDAKPFGRHAEDWLSPDRLRAAKISVSPDHDSLLAALKGVSVLFSGVSEAVAKNQGWEFKSHAEIRAWLDGQTDR